MERCKKLYENDSYIKSFTASVVLCRQNGDYYEIAVDKSAFFPEGGGQEADTGKLSGAQVFDVHEEDGIIWHKTDKPFEIGQTVYGEIDWEKRFSNMQQHSGEHIISGLAHKKFGCRNVGFHLSSREVTLDLDKPLCEKEIAWLERAANRAVFENRKVTVSYPSEEALKTLDYRSKIEIAGQVRIITIDGYDVCACCAPHVAQTGEIGLIKITGCQKYKGGVRLNILCGGRALEDYSEKQDSVSKISAALSAKAGEVYDAVKKQEQEIYELRGKLTGLQEQLVLCKLESLDKNKANVCIFEESLEAPAMKKAVNAMTAEHDGFCGIFVGNDRSGYKYNIGCLKGDAREASKLLEAAGRIRGGGSAQMIQGRIEASREAIEKVFESE